MDNDIYTLKDKLKEGEEGEKFILENYLNKEFVTVIDASKMPRFQHDDIDFIVRKDIPINIDKMLECPNEVVYNYATTLELKSDNLMYKTGNMFIEDYIVVGNRSIPGVLKKCKAHQLLYFDAVSKILYVADFEKVKAYIEENKKSLKYRCTSKKVEVFNCKQTGRSYGYLLNVDCAKENGLLIDVKRF